MNNTSKVIGNGLNMAFVRGCIDIHELIATSRKWAIKLNIDPDEFERYVLDEEKRLYTNKIREGAF